MRIPAVLHSGVCILFLIKYGVKLLPWYFPAFAAANPYALKNELPFLVMVSRFNRSILRPADTAPWVANPALFGLYTAVFMQAGAAVSKYSGRAQLVISDVIF
jgi:hypothetical protein